MAWDFSTEPEFEAKLAWMRTFVRDEIIPLETLGLDGPTFARITAPLKQQVRDMGLWASHLEPELGGGGFGQVKLGLMHEILGQTVYGPSIFGNNAPDSGNAELIALGSTSEEQKEQYLWPLLRGELRSARRVYTDSTARTLHVWIDRDQDNLQDTTEQVTFQVRDDPTGPQLVRFTAAAPTPVLVVRNIALADAFAYPTAPTPTAATRVVTLTFTADARTTGGPQAITVTDSVRLRNVA
jgi:hypothetical protein